MSAILALAKNVVCPCGKHKSLCPCGGLKSTGHFFAPGCETQDTVCLGERAPLCITQASLARSADTTDQLPIMLADFGTRGVR